MPSSPPAVGVKPDEPQILIDQLLNGFRETAEEVVPWFVDQMPLVYFQDTDPASRLTHLRAIIAAKASGQPPTLTLRSEDESQWTYVRPQDYPGVLADVVAQLPVDRPLRAAKIHTARDGQLVVDVFEFGERQRFNPADHEQAKKLEQTIAYAREHLPSWTEPQIREHFTKCEADYVQTITPIRICAHYELFRRVSGTDGTAVLLEPEQDPGFSRIIVAVGNSRTRTMLERIAHRLSRHRVNVHRAHLDLIQDPPNGQVSLLSFVVSAPEGGAIDPEGDLWWKLRKQLLRVKWYDEAVLALAARQPELRLVVAEMIYALANLAHQVLVKLNPYAFARDRIYRLVERHLAQSSAIAELFEARFDPDKPLDDAEFERRAAQILADMETEVDLEDARTLLARMLDAVRASLRTNLFLEDRYCLSIRIDPAFLADAEREELPYGVFFVHGRAFNAFHVRFRDIARGGVRAVWPLGFEQHARETERLYDEAYGLAYAQQLKNKDIPEGGSKAVVLIEPGESISRCVKAFADGLLDLISPDEEVRSRVVDLFGKEELLYLGPDENITPDLIEWIVDRAKRRGYPLPNALMSSKPGAGINHKQFGVTSEGVTVFLDVALRYIGIDPNLQPFTVKITGGPDGDVAGNEIKILHREYGANAKIVGIADGSGVGEDPDGLDHEELLRLVRNSQPIASFDRSKLGPRGRVVGVDEADGFHRRNTMHNRVIADAFIPAGGRPRTIHLGNWRQFLTREGEPSSRVIVEGANLFLTPEARRELSDCGVIILKDSSANKCGVICSSYEIIASMLVSEDEFLANKSRFVEEVLTKLRHLARREAELLFREHRRSPQVPLPEMSIRLSRIVIRASDAIEAAMNDLPEKDLPLVRQLVLDHLPPVLVELAGERLWSRLPKSYLNWMIAASLATRIVYREGLAFLEEMPMAAIADLSFRYLRQERETGMLLDELRSSELPHRRRLAELLERSGTRAGLGDVE